MFEIIENVIKSKDFKLEDILNKIEILWLEGKIGDGEKTSLISLARENAVPENSYKSIEERVTTLYKLVEDLTARVRILENPDTAEDTPEEYPEYVKPTGSHDSYSKGAKMTYSDGKKYISLIDTNVWTPEEYPQGWQEVIEATETETEVAE